jgi:hypothetical protein
MLKKFLPVCLVLLMVMPLIASCTGTNNSAELLIPRTANTVVEVQVSQIISDTALQVAYTEMAQNNPSWPQTVDAAETQLLQKTGLDISGVSTAVYFADIESTANTQNTYHGVIASGSFNESASISKIKQQTQQNLTTTVYQGFTIYTETQNQSCLVFLGNSRFVFGSLKAVQDVIDVSKGTQPALSGSIVDTLKREGSGLVIGATTDSAALLNHLGNDAGESSILSLQSLQNVDNIGFVINQPGLNLSFRLDANFPDTASVKNAENTVNGIISLAKGSNQDSNEKAVLSNVQVSTNGVWLSIQDVLSPADIINLLNNNQTQK